MSKPIIAWRLLTADESPVLVEKIHLNSSSETLDEATRQLPGGAYTTFRTFNRFQVLRLSDHFHRLEETARLAHQPLVLNHARMLRGMHQAMADFPVDEMRVRLILDLEQAVGSVYMLIERLIVPEDQDYAQGVKVITRRMQRQNPKAKLTSFIETAADVRQTVPPGLNEVVMIGEDERALEGLSSNFFAVKDGVIWTAEQGVLLGITRQMILAVIASEGFPLRLLGMEVDQLPNLDEAFLTSASRAVLPVTNIDGHVIGNGQPGPITRALMVGYQQQVAKDLDTVTA